jgi:hypothetical protein
MHKPLTILLLMLAAPGFCPQSGAQNGDEQSRLLAMEDAWNQAVQQQEAPRL